jgi:hypothetical protein
MTQKATSETARTGCARTTYGDLDRKCARNRKSKQGGAAVENTGSGGGNVGTARVARAAPDGYALLCAAGLLVTNPAFLGNVPYDPVRDFAPVAVPTLRPIRSPSAGQSACARSMS